MGFQDEEFDETDETNVHFENASTTPHRIHGIGAMVYWRDCDVTLMEFIDGELKFVRKIQRRTGKGRLDAGETLVFMGEGGKVKTG
jgi:hypothetical protein